MTSHDLAITGFSAYWKRACRAGHAYAEIASRFSASGDPLWQVDARRNLVHGSAVLAAVPLMLLGAFWPWLGAALGLASVAAFARTLIRCAWKTTDMRVRCLYALHSHLEQIPILVGQVGYHLNARLGRRQRLIAYKGVT